MNKRAYRVWGRLALAFFIPLMFLAALEGMFRIFDYGMNPRFVVTDRVDGQVMYRDNPDIGKLWFEPGLARAPVSFMVGEKTNDLRIVLIGESAAMGDPSPSFGLAPSLQVILRHRYPGRSIEVINAGMTAIDSSILVQIARDLAPLKPDMVIVYMGNNEVVGPFGPKANASSRDHYDVWSVRATLWARSLRFGQWIRDMWFARQSASEQTWLGLGQFADREIHPQSWSLRRIHRRFAANTDAILTAIRSYRADSLICTMATRLNWPPFYADKDEEIVVAEELERKGEWYGAYYIYRQLLDQYPGSAEWRYRTARAMMAMGDPEGGILLYKQSRDLDRLRFRADSTINNILRERAGKAVVFVDLESTFDRLWVEPHRFFWDHVHLTQDGNYVAAMAIAREMEPWLESRGFLAEAPIPGFDVVKRANLYTEYDRLLVSTVMHARMLQPPLSSVSHHREIVEALTGQIRDMRSRINRPFLETVRDTLVEAVEKQPHDHLLLNRLAKLHEDLGEYDAAGEIYRELVTSWPNMRSGYQGYGRHLIRAGRVDEGIAMMEEAEIPGTKRPFSVARIEASSVLAELGRTTEALALLDEVLDREPAHARAWYNRATVNNRAGDLDAAVKDFRAALQFQPNMGEAYNNLGVMALKREKNDEAERLFHLALHINPMLISALRNLAMINMLKGDWETARQLSMKLSYLDPELGDVSALPRMPSGPDQTRSQ